MDHQVVPQSPPPDQTAHSQSDQAPHTHDAPEPSKPRNTLGIIALAIAAVGLVFACNPDAPIIGWVLLPIAFILGTVALLQKGKTKWQGVTAIVVTVVATIIGPIMLLVAIAASFSNVFLDLYVEIGDGDTSVIEEVDAEADAAAEPASETGTRENPAAIGSTIESGDWTVVVNSVVPDATDAVRATEGFNEAPDAGHQYMLINYTATYIGKDPEGGMPAFVSVEYVSADGVTFDGLDKLLLAPDAIDTMTTLYEGASVTGNSAIQIPSPANGTIAVRPGMMADKVFVAIQ